ncbi:hypothetical protein ABK040_016478 [Willaertia magna]
MSLLKRSSLLLKRSSLHRSNSFSVLATNFIAHKQQQVRSFFFSNSKDDNLPMERDPRLARRRRKIDPTYVEDDGSFTALFKIIFRSLKHVKHLKFYEKLMIVIAFMATSVVFYRYLFVVTQ